MRLIFTICVLIILINSSESRVYDRCSLAREFYYIYGVPREQIPHWLCLVDKQTAFNTSVVVSNADGSRNHGLFQLNDQYWCFDAKKTSGPGSNNCRLPCSALSDDYIGDDVKCAALVYTQHGPEGWYVWTANCKDRDLSLYVEGCHI